MESNSIVPPYNLLILEFSPNSSTLALKIDEPGLTMWPSMEMISFCSRIAQSKED